ncbi:MAG: hypothetical protein ACU0A8_15610 [Limimaricola soesokkakensis]|uniref:hypothetical protein n=1 Tax=Limimaricola soesokkakensis TaxID=1343159 RepID=UPI0040591D40
MSLGHNGGPSLEPGEGWRRHAWARARRELLPTLPVEVVRLRVKRAAALGLDYRSYASVRAATGHDLIGFLFSSNALRLLRPGDAMPQERCAKLASLAARRVAAVHPPLDPTRVRVSTPIDVAGRAPGLSEGWRATGDRLRAMLDGPADRFLVVGDTALERDWAEAARAAGFMKAERYFGG